MERIKTYEKVGSVNFSSSVFASDPCYSMEYNEVELILNGQDCITNVLPGTFDCFVKKEDDRIKNLLLVHSDVKKVRISDFKFSNDCYVDAGIFGFYDIDYFFNTHSNETIKNEWYERNVLSDENISKDVVFCDINKGIYTSSGYGDGVYPVFVLRNEENKAIGFLVKYF